MDDVKQTQPSGVVPVFQEQPIVPPQKYAEHPVAPVTSAKQETVVIAPPAPPDPVAPTSVPLQHPFIPTGIPKVPVNPPGVIPTPQPPPRPKGGGIPKPLLVSLIGIIVLIALVFGGMKVFQSLTASKEVTLTYWGLWENEEVLAPIIADFEATHPNIKIQYTKQSHKQYRARLQAAIDRGDGPDIFRFHNTWVSMLKSSLSTVPTTIMTATEFASAFYPIASSDLVAGSSIYGMPIMIDGLGLYYNTETFAKKGVSAPPTTWEEVLAMVPKFTERTETELTKSAIALGTTGNVENFSDIVGLMLAQNGAKLSEPSGKEAEEALIFYRKFADPSDPVYTWNDTFDNSIYAFAIGRVAMMFAPSWRAFDIQQMNPSLKFAIAPVPQLPGTTLTWSSYWVEGVSSKSKNQEAAWEFVKYLTSQDAVTKMYTQAGNGRLFGEPYALVSLGTSVAEDPYVGAYIKQAPNAISFPLASRTFDEGFNDKLIKYLEDAINGLASGAAPSAVLETMSAGFRQVAGGVSGR